MNYLQDRNKIFEKKWTDQSTRFRKKLLPDYFRIDEKTVEDFAAFATKFGRQIAFFNLNNRPDGDWASFFRDDPTISLMFLASLPTAQWTAQTNTVVHHFEKAKTPERKLDALKELTALATSILLEVEQGVSRIHEYKNFYEQIVKYINNRASDFFMILSETSKLLRENYNWRNPAAYSFDVAFGSYWYGESPYEFEASENWIDTALFTLAKNLPKLIHDSEILCRETHALLNNEVLESGNVKPHIALFIAFCELYKHAQGKLNEVSERHLEYYYHELLGLRPLQGARDSAYLTFGLVAGSGSVQLEPGTLFNYKNDANGLPQYYVLDTPAQLHEGDIREVRAINISAVPWSRSFMKRNAGPVSVFDLFEKDNQGYELGFELFSQFLVLEEGDRRVTAEFAMDRQETIRLKETINRKLFLFDLKKINEIVSSTWTIFFSNTAGMLPVNEKSMNVFFKENHDGDLSLCFDLLIKKHEPAFVSPEPGNPDGDAVLRFVLNPKGAELYPVFRDMNFAKAKITTEVIGVRNLIVQNDFGALEIEHPFEPFGPRPVCGNNLYIGHKNLFLKPLKELIINLEWNNVPQDEGGFKQYYRDYEGIEDNSSFKVKISSLKDKNWLPIENKQVLNLFTGLQTDDTINDNAISLVRRMNEIDVLSLGLNRGSDTEGPLTEYSIVSTDGFIKMEFCYPEQGFGHDQYSELVQKAAFRAMKKKEEPKPVNEPYTPSLKSISLEYKSEIEISKWGEKVGFRKIQPFGSESVHATAGWCLLPKFADGGCFYLGLNPVLCGKEIALLFKISNKTSRRTVDAVVDLSVSEDGAWREILPEKITYDSTGSLQRTGILKLKLPLVRMSSPDELAWLRFDLSDVYTGLFIEDVHLNAVVVTREALPGTDTEVIAPNTITSLKDPLVQVERIIQPYPSFNGKKPETETDFRTRVSERLRHKSRAVSNQDIEQLLLSEFPEIQSLKCLNHLNPVLGFDPGSTTVVVVPVETEGYAEPERYFQREKLKQMEDFLQRRALSGMKIAVLNPVYEKVRLKFNVKFKPGYDERQAFKKLRAKIMALLNPWNSSKIIRHGGDVPATVLLNEIELEPSVDFVTNFSVFHIVNGQIINSDTAQHNNLIIKPASPVSVLIPDNHHKLLPFNDLLSTDKAGINDMMIGNDFLVNTKLSNTGEGLNFDVLEKTFRLPPAEREITREKHTFIMYLKD